MPHITIARDEQIDAIYRESHALWGAGLELADYRDLWTELSRTPWGREHARFHVWVGDDGRVLSSLKLYRPTLRVRGRAARATFISALFTPAALRGRGHASDLLRVVLEQARRRADGAALLFSDIGTRFYSSFGFRPLPAEEQTGRLPARDGGLAGWSLREMRADDDESVRRAHDDLGLRRSLAIVRDRDHWEFLSVRSSGYFLRLHDSRVGETRMVAEHQGRFVGYLITVEDGREWNVREIGALGGDPEALAKILRLGARRAYASGWRTFYAWLPPEVKPHLRDWRIRSRRRRRAVPMVLDLGGAPDPERSSTPELAAHLEFQDQF